MNEQMYNKCKPGYQSLERMKVIKEMADCRRVLGSSMQVTESIYRSPPCYDDLGGTDCGPAAILVMLKD